MLRVNLFRVRVLRLVPFVPTFTILGCDLHPLAPLLRRRSDKANLDSPFRLVAVPIPLKIRLQIFLRGRNISDVICLGVKDMLGTSGLFDGIIGCISTEERSQPTLGHLDLVPIVLSNIFDVPDSALLWDLVLFLTVLEVFEQSLLIHCHILGVFAGAKSQHFGHDSPAPALKLSLGLRKRPDHG